MNVAHVAITQPTFPLAPIALRGDKHHLSHLFQVVIHQQKIWYRNLHEQPNRWGLIPFGTDEERYTPQRISMDGCNLVIVDTERQVHYKKVAKEWWEGDPRIKGRYQWRSLIAEHNWKGRWCTLPVLGHLVTLWQGKRIQIPQDARGFSICQRGEFSGWLQCHTTGHKHKVVNCTTLVILPACGTELEFKDPYLPPRAQVKIPLPRTAKMTFRALNIASAASTHLLPGYEERALPNGGTARSLALYMLFADLDTLGWNPWMSYTYDPNEAQNKHLLPHPGWNKITLNLPKETQITRHCAILQNGQGKQSREIEIEAQNADGTTGYYRKHLSETEWTFHATNHPIVSESLLLLEERNPEVPFKPLVHHWEGTLTLDKTPIPARVEDFGLTSLRGRVQIDLSGQTHTLLLYRRMNLITCSFFGSDTPTYHLVPEQEIPNTSLVLKKPIQISLRSEKSDVLHLQDRRVFSRYSLVLQRSSQ